VDTKSANNVVWNAPLGGMWTIPANLNTLMGASVGPHTANAYAEIETSSGNAFSNHSHSWERT
jgi:hypothetical protein